MSLKAPAVASLVALASVAPTAVAAERSEEPERCLQLSRVTGTEILSNRQILFETTGRRYYLNTLPYPCPGMRRSSTLMFRTSLNMVCDVDVVTLVDSFGWGLRPGASCGLGRFEPLDESEVEQLRQSARSD